MGTGEHRRRTRGALVRRWCCLVRSNKKYPEKKRKWRAVRAHGALKKRPTHADPQSQTAGGEDTKRGPRASPAAAPQRRIGRKSPSTCCFCRRRSRLWTSRLSRPASTARSIGSPYRPPRITGRSPGRTPQPRSRALRDVACAAARHGRAEQTRSRTTGDLTPPSSRLLAAARASTSREVRVWPRAHRPPLAMPHRADPPFMLSPERHCQISSLFAHIDVRGNGRGKRRPRRSPSTSCRLRAC